MVQADGEKKLTVRTLDAKREVRQEL
jgi:hypothetical protein